MTTKQWRDATNQFKHRENEYIGSTWVYPLKYDSLVVHQLYGQNGLYVSYHSIFRNTPLKSEDIESAKLEALAMVKNVLHEILEDLD